MQYIENIVIGTPLVEAKTLLSLNEEDWEKVEKEKTYFTEERILARILKDIGVVSSVSEVRRNKPTFCEPFAKVDCIEAKWGKRKLYIVVGE